MVEPCIAESEKWAKQIKFYIEGTRKYLTKGISYDAWFYAVEKYLRESNWTHEGHFYFRWTKNQSLVMFNSEQIVFITCNPAGVRCEMGEKQFHHFLRKANIFAEGNWGWADRKFGAPYPELDFFRLPFPT
jgi:hypothetical protein